METVLYCGFKILEKDVLALGSKKDPVYEYEPRYDPKTGERLKDREILISKAKYTFKFEGRTYTSSYVFMQAVAESISCNVVYQPNLFYVLYPDSNHRSSEYINIHNIDRKKLNDLKETIRKLGMFPREEVVQAIHYE